VNQQIVVTVSTGVPFYVVLQQTTKSNQPVAQTSPRNTPTSNASNAEQLRQLLQLQQELNQPSASNQSAQ
jgi:hypothetical protein